MRPLIQWIERVPERSRQLIVTRKQNLQGLIDYLDGHAEASTSWSMSVPAVLQFCYERKGWIERITQIKVTVMTPNGYLYDRTVRNPLALTIFPPNRDLRYHSQGTAVCAARKGLLMSL